MCADVAASADFIGTQSARADFFISACSAYFKVRYELRYREGLLRHFQPFRGYWHSVFAAICGKHLGHEQDFKKITLLGKLNKGRIFAARFLTHPIYKLSV